MERSIRCADRDPSSPSPSSVVRIGKAVSYLSAEGPRQHGSFDAELTFCAAFLQEVIRWQYGYYAGLCPTAAAGG